MCLIGKLKFPENIHKIHGIGFKSEYMLEKRAAF